MFRLFIQLSLRALLLACAVTTFACGGDDGEDLGEQDGGLRKGSFAVGNQNEQGDDAGVNKLPTTAPKSSAPDQTASDTSSSQAASTAAPGVAVPVPPLPIPAAGSPTPTNPPGEAEQGGGGNKKQEDDDDNDKESGKKQEKKPA